MSVKYSVVQQKYDITGKDELKFFAKAQATGVLDFKTICENISDRGTLTKGDVMATIEGCIHVMKQALKEGQIVRLGDFGSFQIGLSSEGTLLEKDFTSTRIKQARIRFRPGEDLRNMLKGLTYIKAATTPSSSTVPVEPVEPDDTSTSSSTNTGTTGQ